MFLFTFILSCLFYIKQGQFFSGSPYRIYLLGNPIIWWSNLIFLFIFLIIYLITAIKEERGYNVNGNDDKKRKFNKLKNKF